MRAWFFVWCLLLAGAASAAFGQAARPLPAAQVGASEIFRALTQPDRPGEVAALKALESQLTGAPDPARLEAARAQLLAIVKGEAARHGDLPQALVMSQIASRFEAAMEGLEAARQAEQSSLAGRLRPFAVPALMLVAGALAAGLVATLLTLWARGRSQEATEELRDMLAKIRRRLEAISHAPQEAGQSGAAEAALDASARLQDIVRSVEAKLLAALDGPPAAAPDARPGSSGTAPGVAEEQARLDALAACLATAAGEVGRLQAAAARLEQIAERHSAGLQADQAADAADEATHNPALADETTASIELLSELAHVANGQCERLDSLIAEAHVAVRTLVDSAAQAAARQEALPDPAENTALTEAALALRGAASEVERGSAQAATELRAAIGQVMAGLEAASATLGETAARLGQASQAALDGTIDMRNETRRFTAQASAAQTTFLSAARAAEDALRLAGEGLSRRLRSAPDPAGDAAQADRDLHLLRRAIETAELAAQRLEEGAAGQEEALSRANEAALALARQSHQSLIEGLPVIAGPLDRAAGD
jgi:hypothetical protein